MELRKKIEEEQRLLMQFAEERLALAQSLLSLLELHVTQANRDISAFESELQVSAALHPVCREAAHTKVLLHHLVCASLHLHQHAASS